jgi:hypothetical protein
MDSVRTLSRAGEPDAGFVGQSWLALRTFLREQQDQHIAPIKLKGALEYLSHSATQARNDIHRLVDQVTGHDSEVSTVGGQHLGKRKRGEYGDQQQQPHPSSDMGPMDLDGMPSSTNGGTRQRRIKAPWKQAVVRVLEMGLTGEKLDLVEAGPEKMLANLAE